MAVNLTKYQDDLLKCWSEVVDDRNPTDWALFSYDGPTYDLKVISKGGKLLKFQLFIACLCRTSSDSSQTEVSLKWQKT